jgi:predicted ABC-type ATPase
MTPMQRRVMIIAGPNGAGKTTFARDFLPREGDFHNFINADLIAEGISPFDPDSAAIRAGELMIAEIHRCAERRENFAFETTLSGRSYARQIPKWQEAGYRVELIFLRLRSVRLAISRVKSRVARGGHHVPASVVRRRFHRGLRNFEELYRPLVDHWILFDNSQLPTQRIEEGWNR